MGIEETVGVAVDVSIDGAVSVSEGVDMSIDGTVGARVAVPAPSGVLTSEGDGGTTVPFGRIGNWLKHPAVSRDTTRRIMESTSLPSMPASVVVRRFLLFMMSEQAPTYSRQR